MWVLGIQTLINCRPTPKELTVPSLRTYFVCSLEDVREIGLENKVFRKECPRSTVGQVYPRTPIYFFLAPELLKYRTGEEEVQERKKQSQSFENYTMGLP